MVDDSPARIAVFAGPTATILNSPPLVTSNLARKIRGLPLRTDPRGAPLRYDALRPQRLAKPVTVYVEQFSAHPLEREAAALYGPPPRRQQHGARLDLHPARSVCGKAAAREHR